MDAIQERLSKTEEKMKKSIAALDNEYKTIRAGRATPAILDKLSVEYYGAPTRIDQMAVISVPEARLMVIQPWDPTTLNAIQKAILASDLGLNPANDGKVLRIAFPPLTEERRRNLAKQSKQEAETAKISVRNARRDAIDALKKSVKADGVPEDVAKDAEGEVQKIHDKYIKKIDELYAAKEKEIMTV